MRPVDWSPLRDGDPVPGDPATIRELANHLLGVAESIRGENGRMASLDAGEIWDSDAAVTFVELQEKLPPDLDKAATRYEGVANALFTWETALGGAQSKADGALTRAQEAQADIDAADSGIDQMDQWDTDARRIATETNDGAAEGSLPVEPEPWPGADWHSLRADAVSRLDAARTDLETAEGDRDDAANVAEGAIDDASHDDLENPGFWESVLLAAADVLSIAAAVLGVLSIFFPVLAPFALIVGLVSMGLNFGLALAGKKGWKDFVIDAIGLATFGIGRSATLLGRLGAAKPFAAAADDAFSAGTDALGAMNRSRAAQTALDARPNLTGFRFPNPNGGSPLVGGGGAQHGHQGQPGRRRDGAAQLPHGDRHVLRAARSLRQHPAPTGDAVDGVERRGPFAKTNALDALRPAWTQGPFGFTGVVTEIGVGTTIGGYQTYDAGSNIFGGGEYYPWNR